MTSGLDRDGPGDAQALLLAAGEAGARLVKPVLHLFPQAGALEAGLDDLVELGPGTREAVDARP